MNDIWHMTEIAEWDESMVHAIMRDPELMRIATMIRESNSFFVSIPHQTEQPKEGAD